MSVGRAREASSRLGRRRVGLRARRRNVWIAVASLLALCGSAASLLGAHLVAQDDTQRARSAFTVSADEVASTLTLALQHEEDLVVSARAYIAGNPNSSQAAFLRWTNDVQALARYPELQGGGEVAFVPNSQLAAFAARPSPPAATALGARAAFMLLPPGRRSFYCLVALTLERPVTGAPKVPPGYDYCAAKTGLREAFLMARDSGATAYIPYLSGSTQVLVVETPIYRGGAVPSTAAARRRSFIGAFGTTEVPQVVLSAALRGHPGVAVELRFGSVHSHVAFRSGRAERGAQTATIAVFHGWTMRASGARLTGGLLADAKALSLLAGGMALSILFALLLLVLGTGRGRALAMVREKTREVSYRAVHDALTGLPNRVLVRDRVERMMARARRDSRIVAAALYIDVDRFKSVNDTFGHAAGDRLLITVADRLSAVVRDEDTVGRLGGDEFVVLLESATREAPPRSSPNA
jgi:hypothetical protein